MITVRFPTGVTIQYNAACYVERHAEYSDLYEKNDKTGWVAQVPNSALIEIKQPCRVYRSPDMPDRHADEIRALRKSVDRMRKRVTK